MKYTISRSGIAQTLGFAATALALWGALVLVFSAPLALTDQVSWRRAIDFGRSFWALWLVFLPGVAWLSFRFPIERKMLFRNVLVHFLACLVVVGANWIASRVKPEHFLSSQHARPAGPSPSGNTVRLGPPGAFGVLVGLRAALDVLVYWSVAGICQAIAHFHGSQERERRANELEASLTSAKLQALRMQIQPHFLFNTLNSISALIYDNPRAADEMIGDLSRLLRRSLDSIGEQAVPLSQELDFIGVYFRIEQKRFGDRFKMEIQVPDDLMRALVPSFLLQPLVENAIRHGIEPKRGPGVVSITAKVEGKHLYLKVRDNGRGLSENDLNTPVRAGIGLANTRARLQGLYGQDQCLCLEATESHGCQVLIRIPFKMEPEQKPVALNDPAT